MDSQRGQEKSDARSQNEELGTTDKELVLG